MANYDKDITGWITVGGRRIPLRKGQSKADAIKSNVKRGEGKTKVFFNSSKQGRYYKDYNSDAAAEDDIKKETKKRGVSVITKEKNKATGLKRKERYDAKTNTWKKDNVPKRLERKKPEQTKVGTLSRNGKRTVVKQNWNAVKKKGRISGRTQAGHDEYIVKSKVKALTDAGLGNAPIIASDKERIKEYSAKNRQELRSRAKSRTSGSMNIKKR